MVPKAAVFVGEQVELLVNNPARYTVEQGRSTGEFTVFTVKRTSGRDAHKFSVVTTGSFKTAACTCRDNRQFKYICRHIIAVYIDVEANGREFANTPYQCILRLLPCVGPRNVLKVAQQFTDVIWPTGPARTTATPLEFRGAYIRLQDTQSLTQEYRSNAMTSIMQAINLVAEGLSDENFQRFYRSMVTLTGEFSNRPSRFTPLTVDSVDTSRSSSSTSSASTTSSALPSQQLVIRNPNPVGRAKVQTLGRKPTIRAPGVSMDDKRAGARRKKGAYACANCKKAGHRQNHCHAPCGRCGDSGHTIANCPNKRQRVQSKSSTTTPTATAPTSPPAPSPME